MSSFDETITEHARTSCDHLLILNASMFESGHFEAAYYLLVAAMHYAKDERDAHVLALIERIAQKQGEWVEINLPESFVSSKALQDRQTLNLFHALSRQAATLSLIMEAKQGRQPAYR